ATRARGSPLSSSRALANMFTGSSAPARRRNFLPSTPRQSMSRPSCGACCFATIVPASWPAPRSPSVARTSLISGIASARLGSPFDFQKQMRMFIVKKMPDPRETGYEEALEHWIAHFVEKTDGCAFVLFTSYRGMQQVAERMRDFFARQKLHLLVQGEGAPRGRLLEQFKTTPRSVLFGTDSF